jgi:Acetyltransferase (GNAT) domain
MNCDSQALTAVVQSHSIASQEIGLVDLALPQVPLETRRRFRENERTLFDSFGFSEWYCNPPAERAAYLADSEGKIHDKCFYRESSWLGLGRRIEITSPIHPNGRLAREIRKRNPHALINILFLSSGTLDSARTDGSQLWVQEMADNSYIDLPADPEEYLQTLGKATRKHLPYYWRRVQREWGSEGSIAFFRGKEITRAAFDGLIELNRLRMVQHGRLSGWSRAVADTRWKLFQECGLFGAVSLHGQLVAGALSLMHGQDAYLIVLAHDPQFDRFNLGNLSLWLTINHLIETHVCRLHLLWGDSFYKRQFGGKKTTYYRAVCFPYSGLATAFRIADAAGLSRVALLLGRIPQKCEDLLFAKFPRVVRRWIGR